MKNMKKALSLVLSLIMAFSVLAIAAVSANAYEQDSGKHYVLPTSNSITGAAMFAVGETVYGSLINNEQRFYKVINAAVRDLEFTVRADKKIKFTVSTENGAEFTVGTSKVNSYNADVAANTASTITLKGAPVGTYYIQIDGTGADNAKTEYSISAYAANLSTLTLRINNKTAKMVSGDALALQLSDMSVNYLNYYWESVDDPKTIDIDESKIVTVNDDGIVSVAFPTAENKFSKTINVTVRAVFYYSTAKTMTEPATKSCVITAEPANVFLEPYVTELKLGANATRTIKATTNVKNGTIDWSTSDPSIVTVSKQGVITTGAKEGSATLTAAIKYDGTVLKIRREIAVTVSKIFKSVKAVSFNEKDITIGVNSQRNLSCTLVYSDDSTEKLSAESITFTSSDENLVTVNKAGTITTKELSKSAIVGTATITATVNTPDGVFTDTCNVKVYPNWLMVLVAPVKAVVQLVTLIYNWIKNR